ncbi:MAG TPA: polyprenyl synthetase family protein [Balneolales bacterium]|nr:polyprenyl synthetase family protein [Balneolales bacterium]
MSDRQNPKTLQEIRNAIDPELHKFRTFFKDALRTDVYLLDKIITYLLKTKGKEMRPMLVFMSAQLTGEINDRTYIAATMIELLHTATLIHDDVVDDAERRRGFLSINRIWKNKASILLGDFLLAKGLIVSLENDEFQLLKVLSQAVKRMSEGELRQLKASKLLNMTKEKYFQIISDKTGSLITACCQSGAISATGNEEYHETMRLIGENIGTAFQIRDDLFDYGVDDVGKPTANDIKERKITLPLIAALESASLTERKHIRKLFKKHKKKNSDIKEIIEFVKDKGGIEYTRNVMNSYVNKAYELLQQFPESESRNNMEDLIYFVVTRKK